MSGFREYELTKGSITKNIWTLAIPLILGNIMQQFYNLADTWIVGRFIGNDALAAVGSSYTLITFLTSFIIGLCLGSSTFVSQAFGRGNESEVRNGIFLSAVLIGGISIAVNICIYILLDAIMHWMRLPAEILDSASTYLYWIFAGFSAMTIYNFFTNILRGLGDTKTPLILLTGSVILNIVLDIFLVAVLSFGIRGAALATVIAQYTAGIGSFMYFTIRYRSYCPGKENCKLDKATILKILELSGFTCMQQSLMNFGILMIQGLVNSFGATVMAAFTIAVKIDTICYMPVQDFGNAFSIFVAQNYGAGKKERIRKGMKSALWNVTVFCVTISTFVFLIAEKLMRTFVSSVNGDEIIRIGSEYLRIEGAFYLGIGILFLLYGYFRAIGKPFVSVILTVISLGTRVLLAYTLSPVEKIGVNGIWAAIPIGWFLADTAGLWIMKKRRQEL